MIYAEPLRTRATECGPDKWITLPAVISYLEHLRWEWLRVPELGLVDAIHDGHGFYVTRQQIALSRRFGQGVDAQVRGVLRKVGRVEAHADQDLVRSDGVSLARCHIRGVWTDADGQLSRIPRQAREAVSALPLASERGQDEARDPTSLFDPPQPLRPASLEPRIEGAIPEQVHRRSKHVRATDCDIFQHVNAANYARWVADSLAAQGASPSLHSADLQYLGQALGGDPVDVLTWPLGDTTWGAAVVRGDDVLFRAVVETEPTLPRERRPNDAAPAGVP